MFLRGVSRDHLARTGIDISDRASVQAVLCRNEPLASRTSSDGSISLGVLLYCAAQHPTVRQKRGTHGKVSASIRFEQQPIAISEIASRG
jgi:hypothetical protein